jgi:predicted O-methyltransferase YrrM
VVEFLERRIDRSSFVFEFGAGGSTIWFAEHAGEVVSIEDNEAWCDVVRRELAASTLNNAQVVLRDTMEQVAEFGEAEGLGIAEADVILVDSSARVRILDLTLAKRTIKPGGYLVLDDSQRAVYDAYVGDLAGWPRRDFWGLRAHFLWPSRTTCWRRPPEAS